MITKNQLIEGWNNAGKQLNADLLGLVFKKLETNDDVAIHNFIMSQINERLGPTGGEFALQVAELIARLSLRNKDNATKEEKGQR
jgi:hypothetical protein